MDALLALSGGIVIICASMQKYKSMNTATAHIIGSIRQ